MCSEMWGLPKWAMCLDSSETCDNRQLRFLVVERVHPNNVRQERSARAEPVEPSRLRTLLQESSFRAGNGMSSLDEVPSPIRRTAG
jgi:hypothetical protein